MKDLLQKVSLFIISVVIALFLSELILYLFFPQPCMYPWFKFSKKYGTEFYKNTAYVHELRNKWKYTYYINSLGHRGKLTEIKKTYTKPNIVVLGDSYTVGFGVEEGQEYTAVLDTNLPDYNIINLGCAGWGLTHEIRRFYELGILYQPQIVILQFCRNDPNDNLRDKVTIIENDSFKFVNTSYEWLINSWNHPVIQKSHLLNLLKNSIAKKRKNNAIEADRPYTESFYNTLLEKFALNLSQRGIRLIMIAVQGDLTKYKIINRKVEDLGKKHLLDYVEVSDWLDDKQNYASPEGHKWNEKAHQIIGKTLAQYINGSVIF